MLNLNIYIFRSLSSRLNPNNHCPNEICEIDVSILVLFTNFMV